MKRLYIPLLLFLLLILEGVAIDFLPSTVVMGNQLFTPHWVAGFLVLVAVLYDKDDTYFAVVYALIFGLLLDAVYAGVLGVYMFSYTVSIYIIQNLKKMLHGNFFVVVLLGVVGIIIADIMIYIIYLIIGMTDMFWQDYLFNRLLPTVLLNLLFMIIIYPLFAKRVQRWGNEQLD
ncbi:rod shape-determining protein MreD [Oceanobacillus chungangensis]|uniref:Rod shape-determining protein MreD n=1 Tax=Oceanobacillus chungangensis TaxID=1229152 RepID=A0A3D8Q3A8_9BACI|nr:rod shape-determining protein MreD [Oceanobacillus chungangensis]RDW21665.1 rod shape-determining protein MreD [Oceanobacillus chungangensis]